MEIASQKLRSLILIILSIASRRIKRTRLKEMSANQQESIKLA